MSAVRPSDNDVTPVTFIRENVKDFEDKVVRLRFISRNAGGFIVHVAELSVEHVTLHRASANRLLKKHFAGRTFQDFVEAKS